MKETTNIEYNWSDKKILIAEDEMMNYLYLEEALRETNAFVVWCQNGQEAVDKVIKESVEFDVILMDVKMPRMNGYEATKLIKEFNSKIPIVIQTAFAMPDERAKGFSVGCNDYLEKPIRQKKLLSILDEFLK